MSEDLTVSFFGNTERVFIGERQHKDPFVVRPAVVLVDGNQIRFRNFTRYPVRIDASFLAGGGVRLEPAGQPGDKRTQPLGSQTSGYYEYIVWVITPGGEVEAVGSSRPGAIIDR